MNDSTPQTNDKGCGPLVMTFIGNDDPARGDSRSATGVGRTIAEMLDGRFVYVDEEMLRKSFPNLDGMKDRLLAYLKQEGEPNIVVGSMAGKVPVLTKDRLRFNIDAIAEILSARTEERDIVAHHLTRDGLKKAGKDFREQYPDIKGPLLGVMMGGYIYHARESRKLAQKIVAISHSYPELTVFICPSRRTGRSKDSLVKDIEHYAQSSKARLGHSFQSAVRGHVVEGLKHLFMGAGRKLNLMHVDYETAIESYNPYMGLLAEADHLICAGHSYSIVSEALYTGKNIYTFAVDADYKELKAQKYICDVKNLNSFKPFPTVKKVPLDNTRTVAESFVKEYKSALLAYETYKASTASQSMPEAVCHAKTPAMT